MVEISVVYHLILQVILSSKIHLEFFTVCPILI